MYKARESEREGDGEGDGEGESGTGNKRAVLNAFDPSSSALNAPLTTSNSNSNQADATNQRTPHGGIINSIPRAS